MNKTIKAVANPVTVCLAVVLTTWLCMGQTTSPVRSRAPGRTTGTVPPPYDAAMPRPPQRIEGGNYYYDLAEVHKRYGVYPKAVEMLEMAIEKETNPDRKTRYYESLSDVYRIQGKTKEAAEQMNKALAGARSLQEKCRYNTMLGAIYEQAGDIEGAKNAYEFVVANATRDVQKRGARLSLFRLYQKAGELDDVIADLEKKVQDNPNDEDALGTLALLFNSVARESSKALPIYEKLSKLKPEDATILNQLVHLYQANREYDKAAEAYQRIIEASPSRNKGYYYQHVSRMYMQAGKTKEAMQWAEKSLSAEPVSPFTYATVARLYLENNLPEKAVQLYDRALAASRRPVEKHQVSLRFADLFARNKMEDRAEKIYRDVMEGATVATFRSQARSQLIALYRKQGKTKEIEALTGKEETGGEEK